MRPRSLFLACLLFIPLSWVPGKLGAEAAPPRILQYLSESPELPSQKSEPPKRLVQVDVGLFQNDPDELTLTLPDGREVTAQRSYWSWESFDTFAWSGELRGDPAPGAGGSLSLYSIQGRVYGDFRGPDGTYYRLVPGGAHHNLIQEEPTHGETCGVSHATASLADNVAGLENLVSPLSGTTQQDCGSVTSPLTQIDVLVLYPRSLAASAQAVRDYASMQVFNATLINARSGLLNVRYDLARVAPITGPQPPPPLDFSNDPDFPEATGPVLQWLNDQFDGELDTEVELLRNAYGADMVSIVIPPHPNSNCGLANLPFLSGTEEMVGKAPNDIPFGNRAFTVVELDCDNANYTFAHELGHTWGLRHDDNRNPVANIFPWSYGYIVPVPDGAGGPRATLMACVPDGGDCKRIDRLSNPDLTWNGVPTGLHSGPSDDPAHSACAVNLRASNYENFAHRPPSAPPTLEIRDPVDGLQIPAGTSLRLAAIATDPEDGNLASAVQWTSDRSGSLGTGSPRIVALDRPGRHLITAEVADSSSTKIRTSVIVDVSEGDPPRIGLNTPAHQQVARDKIQVVGWAMDASGVTDVTFVLDGHSITLENFVYGTRRLDACKVHADLSDPNCPWVGFQGDLDTRSLSNGPHTLKVVAQDFFGNTQTLVRSFQTDNEAILPVAAQADAWVSEAQPHTNFGEDVALQLRASGSGDARHAYLKFQVSGVLRPVQSATLHLRYSSDPFSTLRVYWIKSNKWTESGITWFKAPTDFHLQYQVTVPPPDPATNRFEVDVTPIISGDGTYTIGIVAPDVPEDQWIVSKEAGFGPELEVRY